MARSKSDKAFDERVAQYSEELRELLTDLYGEQADEAFRNLTELMAKAHDARPADLKRLDTKRLADPEWYKRGNNVRYDHVHRSVRRGSEETRRQSAVPEGTETHLSAPDATAENAASAE